MPKALAITHVDHTAAACVLSGQVFSRPMVDAETPPRPCRAVRCFDDRAQMNVDQTML